MKSSPAASQSAKALIVVFSCHHRSSLNILDLLGAWVEVLSAVGLRWGAAVTTLVLNVLVVHVESLLDLGAKGVFVGGPVICQYVSLLVKVTNDLQAQQLIVVHLQQHARDLTRQLRLLGVDLRVQSLTKHLLLLRRRSAV
jgi:hypothetical protein